MKSEPEFHNYFDSYIDHQLIRLKKDRNRFILVKRSAIFLIILANIIVYVYTIINLPPSSLGSAVGFTLFAGILYYGITYNSSSKYTTDFQESIVKEIVHFINPDLDYDPDRNILQPAFVMSKIFFNEFTDYNGSDFIEGNIGETLIHMSWLDIVEPNAISKTQFKGIFFVANFNKDFNGETFVIARTETGLAGEKMDEMHIGRPPFVKLENPDFTKNFSVFADDPIEARLILSPVIMEKMVNMNRKTPYDISFSFLRSYMFVAVSIRENIFDPQVSAKNYDTVLNFFNYLNLTLNIVDDFELNSRKWGNETSLAK